MTDLEQRIRDLLEEDARAAPPPNEMAPVVGRTRRRQIATLAGSALGVVALVAVSFVGVRAVLTTDGGTPADAPTVTTTMNGITITYPEAWHVIDPDDAGLNGPPGPTLDFPRIILALSPTDPGELFGCPGMVEGTMPTFLMTVQEEPLALDGPDVARWPIELESMSVGTAESGCYPGWEFLRAGWTAEGRTFEARVGLAPEISSTDREALFAAFASLAFESLADGATSVVIATGTAGGEDWELIAGRDLLTNSGESAGLELMLQAESIGTGMGGFDADSTDLQVSGYVFGRSEKREVVVFGAVPENVVRVEAFPALGGPAVSVDVLDVPEEIEPRLNAFVLVAVADLPVELNAYDAAGDVILRGTYNDGQEPTETPLPVDGTVPQEVQPVQGGMSWGLYLAVSRSPDDPGMDEAFRGAQDLGYTPAIGDIACDMDAAIKLGVPSDWSRVAIYFATREDAEFAARRVYTVLRIESVGLARVTTYCLD